VVLTRNSNAESETEMSPASQAPLIYNGPGFPGLAELAMGLAETAASQLNEFVRWRVFAFWAKPGCAGPDIVR